MIIRSIMPNSQLVLSKEKKLASTESVRVRIHQYIGPATILTHFFSSLPPSNHRSINTGTHFSQTSVGNHKETDQIGWHRTEWQRSSPGLGPQASLGRVSIATFALQGYNLQINSSPPMWNSFVFRQQISPLDKPSTWPEFFMKSRDSQGTPHEFSSQASTWSSSFPLYFWPEFCWMKKPWSFFWSMFRACAFAKYCSEANSLRDLETDVHLNMEFNPKSQEEPRCR